MKLRYPDYCGRQLILKAPLFLEPLHAPTPRFQRKVTNSTALSPAQSCYSNLIGMLLVPQQSYWPDAVSKGPPSPHPKPTKPRAVQMPSPLGEHRTKRWAWARGTKPHRRGQERGRHGKPVTGSLGPLYWASPLHTDL